MKNWVSPGKAPATAAVVEIIEGGWHLELRGRINGKDEETSGALKDLVFCGSAPQPVLQPRPHQKPSPHKQSKCRSRSGHSAVPTAYGIGSSRCSLFLISSRNPNFVLPDPPTGINASLFVCGRHGPRNRYGIVPHTWGYVTRTKRSYCSPAGYSMSIVIFEKYGLKRLKEVEQSRIVYLSPMQAGTVHAILYCLYPVRSPLLFFPTDVARFNSLL